MSLNEFEESKRHTMGGRAERREEGREEEKCLDRLTLMMGLP